jgi:hypothetical protein
MELDLLVYSESMNSHMYSRKSLILMVFLLTKKSTLVSSLA